MDNLNMKIIDDDSEGHLFKKGDKLKIEAEKAEMTIKQPITQEKDGMKHLGYFVELKKLDGSYNGIRTVNEQWIKDLPLIN
jgi:hypothetical protein